MCVDEFYLTCLLCAQSLGKAGNMLDLLRMHSKKQIQEENEVYDESHGPARNF